MDIWPTCYLGTLGFPTLSFLGTTRVARQVLAYLYDYCNSAAWVVFPRPVFLVVGGREGGLFVVVTVVVFWGWEFSYGMSTEALRLTPLYKWIFLHASAMSR